MTTLHLEWNPVGQQLESLRALVEELRRDVVALRAENAELRRENAELRRQVNGLRCSGRRQSLCSLWSATDSNSAATETAAEKYLRNEHVGSSVAGEVSATASDASHHLAVAIVCNSPLHFWDLSVVGFARIPQHTKTWGILADAVRL